MDQEENPISLAILEDHEYLIKGLLAEFRASGFQVCGTSAEPDAFLEIVAEHKPAVVVIDLKIRGQEDMGIDVIEQVRRASPDTRIVIYTFYPSFENFFRAFRAGVNAFIRKESDTTPQVSLVEAIRLVARGIPYFDPELHHQLGQAVELSRIPNRHSQTKTGFRSLTQRQAEILGLYVQGYSTTDIAEKLLTVSKNTVKAHTKHIRAKLGVNTMKEAIILARGYGYPYSQGVNPLEEG